MNWDDAFGSRKRCGFSVVDALAAVGCVAVLLAVMLPAMVCAEGEDSMTICLSHAKGLGDALLAYAADHDGRMPGDGRDLAIDDGWDQVRVIPESERDWQRSWLFKLQGKYISADPAVLDCPLVDDQRKGEWRPTDYVINRWAVNNNTAIVQDPSRAVLVAEPNMARGAVTILADVIAWSDWGPRPDLEQNQVNSLSIGFVDGHASRIAVPEGNSPQLANYSDIYMAKQGDSDYLSNWLWWTQNQEATLGH